MRLTLIEGMIGAGEGVFDSSQSRVFALDEGLLFLVEVAFVFHFGQGLGDVGSFLLAYLFCTFSRPETGVYSAVESQVMNVPRVAFACTFLPSNAS